MESIDRIVLNYLINVVLIEVYLKLNANNIYFFLSNRNKYCLHLASSRLQSKQR